MSELKQIYNTRIELKKTELSDVKKRLKAISLLRLSLFLAAFCAIYLSKNNIQQVLIILGFSTLLFVFLISVYNQLKSKKKYLEAYITENTNEINALKGVFTPFQNGQHYFEDEHAFSFDIDLFGSQSFFHQLNRTKTSIGEEKLASYLNSNDINGVEIKQKIIQEFSDNLDWRQHFQVTASLTDKSFHPKTLVSWMTSYQPVLSKKLKLLPYIISALSLIVITLNAFDVISTKTLMLYFFIGLTISGAYFKRITTIYTSASKAKDMLSSYSKLLDLIEKSNFNTPGIKDEFSSIQNEHASPSVSLKKLTVIIERMGQRNNLLLAPISNGFMLTDIKYALKMEDWIEKNKLLISKWFETIAFTDAYLSFANYNFNHPLHTCPIIENDKKSTLNAANLRHPLINIEVSIPNSIQINTTDFIIITGANMAGKSTFLRTVALNLVMANCGLKVAAKSFLYRPLKLISSMRTSDSLLNDESYFFSELKRLKHIVTQLEQDEYFIILDEILKGTNSKDKAEGSALFVERLINSNATGLIATHDLSLCTLSTKFTQIKNHYFDAEIINNELFFDYTFKNGICQNMNASFLLKKMEII